MKGSNGKWLLGDSLRRNPDNLMYNHNQDLVKEKMKTGSYATIHVDKFASNSYKWLYFYTIQVSSFAHWGLSIQLIGKIEENVSSRWPRNRPICSFQSSNCSVKTNLTPKPSTNSWAIEFWWIILAFKIQHDYNWLFRIQYLLDSGILESFFKKYVVRRFSHQKNIQ